MKFGGSRPGIRSSLNDLAKASKKGYVMRKYLIVPLSSAEDVESSVLPMRGIKKGKRELGKILFLHPLIQNSPRALLISLLTFSITYGISHWVSCCSRSSLGLGFEMIRRLAI